MLKKVLHKKEKRYRNYTWVKSGPPLTSTPCERQFSASMMRLCSKSVILLNLHNVHVSDACC